MSYYDKVGPSGEINLVIHVQRSIFIGLHYKTFSRTKGSERLHKKTYRLRLNPPAKLQ